MGFDLVPHSAHERLLEMMNDGAIIVDGDGLILWANRALGRLLGTTAELRGTPLDRWFIGTPPLERLATDRRMQSGYGRRLKVSAVGGAGDMELYAHPRADGHGSVVVIRPFDSTASSFDRIISFATRDAITQLLNRDSFQEKLSFALDEGGAGCVLCADVNQFSAINSVYGYAEGDTLLRAVAARLRAAVGNGGPLGRVYGGRFAAFLTGANQVEARARSEKLAEILHRTMATPFEIAGGMQPVSLSIGIATWPADAADADDLIGAAETAINTIPPENWMRTCWFEPAMQADRRMLLELGADLRLAIEHNMLTLHYQPKVASATREVVGFEALARWQHPTKGMIPPSVFIPVAEQSHLIVDLGNWALREACRQQAAWREQGLRLMPVAVNMSPQHLLSEPLCELLDPLAQYHLSLSCIEIEITESALMDKLSASHGVIDSLRRSGLQISIDDFGTGHSSLNNLRRLPIDALKIDRSFVEDIEHSTEAHDIVATIVAMAKALSLGVVAEGVETEAQAALLRSHGVEVMQGYLFAHPLPGAEAGKLLKRAAGRPDTK